jgi:hypothetical protein
MFIHKASKPAPKLNVQQKAYIVECSCFILSSVAILYPEFAAKISPSSLEKLLSHFVSKCKTQTKGRMTGGALSLRSASRKVGRFSIFPGVMVLIYALLLTRASVDQMNKQNPFRAGRYEMFDLAKDELAKEDLLKETMMVEITRENIMKWVSQPSMQLSEMTNTLSLKAIRIVGVVTRKHTEGLEQQVRDHCLGESAQLNPNLNLGPELGTELTEYVAPIPESRWDTFKSMSWSTLSSLATSADQIADRIAKTHLNSNTLFDMPGCIGRVNELKFQELMDQMKHEHARIKLDIDMWMKKGQNDITFIFSLFRIAIGMILTSLGYTLLPKNNTRKGNSYNLNALNANALNSPPLPRAPSIGPQIPFQLSASRPYLQMPQLAEEQPYIQSHNHLQQIANSQDRQREAQRRAIENAQAILEGPIRKATEEAQQRAAEASVREAQAQAQAHVRDTMARLINPANQVAKKRSAEYRAVENAAQRRQENFAELLRRTNSLSKKLRSVK